MEFFARGCWAWSRSCTLHGSGHAGGTTSILESWLHYWGFLPLDWWQHYLDSFLERWDPWSLRVKSCWYPCCVFHYIRDTPAIQNWMQGIGFPKILVVYHTTKAIHVFVDHALKVHWAAQFGISVKDQNFRCILADFTFKDVITLQKILISVKSISNVLLIVFRNAISLLVHLVSFWDAYWSTVNSNSPKKLNNL